MSLKAKKILITTERREQTVIHFKRDRRATGQCSECGGEVVIVALDDGARCIGIGTRELLRSIDAGAIHALESADGILGLCGRSLALRLASNWTSSNDEAGSEDRGYVQQS